MGKAKIDSTSSAYDAMEWRLEKAGALWGGTATMRQAGPTFLPAYSAETPRNWRTRLARAVLFNYFKKTASALGGKPFSRKLQVKEVDPKIEECLDNIDLQGNSFHVVAQREFTKALAKGLAIFLVDFPTNTATNAAEERSLNLRPYLVSVAPENLLAAYVGQNEKGEEIVTHARVYSEEIERVDYDEVVIQTVMVYEPGVWQKWQRRSKSQTYGLVASGTTPLGYVPILAFYTEKEAPFVSRPTLEDLADKNIEHWQSSSDQRHCLTVTRFPMLAGKGIAKAEGELVKVGPYETLFAENPTSEFYYVEHTGAALAAGKQDLDDLKAEMAVLALELTAPKDRQTATSAALDANDNLSLLQMLAINYEDYLERLLEIMADWLQVDHEFAGGVELFKEFNLSGLDAKVLDTLIAAKNAGQITTEEFLIELVRRGVLRADLDIDEAVAEAEKAQAEKEAKEMDTKKLDLAARAKAAVGNTGSNAAGKTPAPKPKA